MREEQIDERTTVSAVKSKGYEEKGALPLTKDRQKKQRMGRDGEEEFQNEDWKKASDRKGGDEKRSEEMGALPLTINRQKMDRKGNSTMTNRPTDRRTE